MELLGDMEGRVLERDLKPKSKMVIKAEGDNPEEMKEEIINKLSSLDLPEESEMAEMAESSLSEEDEEMPEEMMEDELDLDEEVLNEMPLSMKEKLLRSKKRL